ncbi:MAG: hypothetical protein ACJ76F_05965 [Bacteroidia bacterium]
MNRTETRTMFIVLDEHGIIRMQIKEGAELDVEDAADNLVVVRNLSAGQPALKLVDSRVSWKISDEAKKYLEEDDDPKRTIARAVIQRSIIEKWITTFLSKLNRPETPIKFFTDEKEALDWLRSFRK